LIQHHHHQQQQQQALGGVELVMGVSIKLDNGYTGIHMQEMANLG
jgi:hypothetical protein